jgi:hypothetical protein
MHWLKVGVFSTVDEMVVDGYVKQSDRSGIKTTWFATATSGIVNYLYNVTAEYTGMVPILQTLSECIMIRQFRVFTVQYPLIDWTIYYIQPKCFQ